MRVSVDEDSCIGSGQCVLAVPAVFDQEEKDGTVLLREEQPSAAVAVKVRHAAMTCPARAITVVES
jgi:ferredoxin